MMSQGSWSLAESSSDARGRLHRSTNRDCPHVTAIVVGMWQLYL
jgi:hypothetical protein